MPLNEPKNEIIFCVVGSNLNVFLMCSAGTTIPSLDTMSMLVDGIRYDELPVVHIKSSPNNTIIHVTDHTGK
jgi:hypothetical protein